MAHLCAMPDNIIDKILESLDSKKIIIINRGDIPLPNYFNMSCQRREFEF